MKKKILVFLLAVMVTAVFLPAAMAASWDNPDVTSPYSVTVIPVRQRTVFGQAYTDQYFGTAVAGDDISMAIRVEVPDKPRAATLTVKAQNAVLDCALTATLPMTQGVYYLKSTGEFSSVFTVITGYATGSPTVTATITGTERVTSVGQYSITRSDGYIVASAGRGVQFCPDAKGKIYTSYVIGSNFKTKLTSYILTEDSEAGVIARDVLRVMGIDGAALLGGNVYMTDRLLAANFGVLIDTEFTKTWGITASAPTTTLPVTAVADVPSTGWKTDAIVIGGICVLCLIVWLVRKDVRDFIRAAKEDKRRE